MKLSRHTDTTRVPARAEPHVHVAVSRTRAGTADGTAPPTPGEWDHMHMVLAAWKARSLLADALGHLRGALPVGPVLDPTLADEFRSAIDATAATIERLQTVTAAARVADREPDAP